MANFGFDEYEINARLRPALFAALPAPIAGVVWFGADWPTLSAIVSFAGLCGFTYLLSRVARGAGKLVQSRLTAEMGGLPSTILLRHSDSRIAAPTKDRYHAFLRAKGLKVPTSAEEISNPLDADKLYASCGDYLREMTRDKQKFNLIRQENIDFGYRRNLLGLRPFAIGLILTLMAIDGAIIYVGLTYDKAPPWPSVVLGLGLVAALGCWLLIISRRFVSDAGWSYAERLLAACEQFDGPPKTSSIILPR